MQKPNPQRFFIQLTEDQESKLAGWMLAGTPYWKCRELIRQEFDIEPPASNDPFTLFWREFCEPALLARRRRAVQTSQEIVRDVASSPGEFSRAALDQLQQLAFELSLNPAVNPKNVKDIFSLVLQARAQDLNQQGLQVRRDKLELELQKYKDQVEAAKKQLEQALLPSTEGAVTKETLQRAAEALQLL